MAGWPLTTRSPLASCPSLLTAAMGVGDVDDDDDEESPTHRKMAVGEETEARAGSLTPEVKVTRCSGDRLLTNPDEVSELQNVIKVIRSRAAPLSSCLLPCSCAPLALRASSLLPAPLQLLRPAQPALGLRPLCLRSHLNMGSHGQFPRFFKSVLLRNHQHRLR